jgi:segregation and condensation protein B
MELKKQLESLLFISHKPLSLTELAKLLTADKTAVENELNQLIVEYSERAGGIEVLKIEDKYQMSASGENAELIAKFLNTEMAGDLTKPSLETLTIIAYRGPISKAELELIRGINCSMILRNLLMRGLIEAREDKVKGVLVYQITFEFLKYLGINNIEELPEFQILNRSNNLEKLLQGLTGNDLKSEVLEETSEPLAL